MKPLFRNILSVSVLLFYGFGAFVSLHNAVGDTVLSTDSHKNPVSVVSKTPASITLADTDSLYGEANDFLTDFETGDLKTSFLTSKYKGLFSLNKAKAYIKNSTHIQPGLSLKTLLYPFHTFS